MGGVGLRKKRGSRMLPRYFCPERHSDAIFWAEEAAWSGHLGTVCEACRLEGPSHVIVEATTPGWNGSGVESEGWSALWIKCVLP